jgi:hypothetical protein
MEVTYKITNNIKNRYHLLHRIPFTGIVIVSILINHNDDDKQQPLYMTRYSKDMEDLDFATTAIHANDHSKLH